VSSINIGKESLGFAWFFMSISAPMRSNLVSSFSANFTPVVRNALQCVHELGTLYNQSGKFKRISLNTISQSATLTTTEKVHFIKSK
jgi:hypothetical protein